MSPKAKILSVLKGEIKYFFRAAGAKFFEQNSCQSGFSFRKIVFGKRFREEFSEKNPTWEVSISISEKNPTGRYRAVLGKSNLEAAPDHRALHQLTIGLP